MGVGSRLLILTSNVPARGVFLELEGCDAFFGDNFFDILPGVTLIVDLFAEPSDLGSVGDRITVRTLYDTIP